jgi:hypothetical protein
MNQTEQDSLGALVDAVLAHPSMTIDRDVLLRMAAQLGVDSLYIATLRLGVMATQGADWQRTRFIHATIKIAVSLAAAASEQ